MMDKAPNDWEINTLLFSEVKSYSCLYCMTIGCRIIVKDCSPCGNFRAGFNFCKEIKCNYCTNMKYGCFLVYQIKFIKSRDGVMWYTWE